MAKARWNPEEVRELVIAVHIGQRRGITLSNVFMELATKKVSCHLWNCACLHYHLQNECDRGWTAYQSKWYSLPDKEKLLTEEGTGT
jgi:hypothetical protein